MGSTVNQLYSWAASLTAKFTRGGETSCVDGAIDLGREALELRPPGHPERSVSLTSLANRLGDRYNKLGSIRDLEEAIVLDRETLELHPKGHPSRSVSLNNLAVRLVTRYNRLGVMEDLDEAIALALEALHLRPKGHPDRSISLNNLTVCLSTRYKQLGIMEDLDEAIAHARQSLDLRPKGHPHRSMSLISLAVCIHTRYMRLGVMEDLDEAIVLDREALDLRPRGHPDRLASLNNLAVRLSTRYKELGVVQDLNEAIALDREAVYLCQKGHPGQSTSLDNLAVHLSTRYKRLGVIEDLDEAIVLDREALDLCPKGYPGRPALLGNLAFCLSTRYNQLGVMEDLDAAIALNREALDLRPKDHPNRSATLSNLAVYLSTRYKLLGAMGDLDEAIVLGREALDLRPKGHPDRAASLNNLANYLSTRYNQLGIMDDLDAAIVLDRQALDLLSHGHSDRSTLLMNLAVRLSTRYTQLGVRENLEEAIALDQEALDLRPKGHPDRSMSLNNLAIHLSTRYKQRGVIEDLDEAIVLGREALDLRPKGHPDRSMSLDNLARRLYDRFMRLRQSQDKEELFNLYAQLVYLPPNVSSNDLSAARAWIHAAEDLQHPSVLLAYETSLRLLIQHLAILPSLPRHLSILKIVTSSLAVDAFSACLRNHSPAKALELLEQGRGVFWNQLTRLRSPLDDVIASGMAGKGLADEFTRLASLVRHVLDSPGTDQHEQLCHLNLEMQRVVNNIRELPGLSRFLLPSLFSDLQRAASGGPVIIVNASQYGCDVLVILLDRDSVHIPLEITREDVRDLSTELRALTVCARRSDMTRQLAGFLRKLWDRIVSPIVDLLQTTVPSHSRIWWCPTGEFSVLPLHAAGPFRKGQQSLPDLYISSYTPTLTALIRARHCDPSDTLYQQRRFVAIGQAKAAGESELFSVRAELENIGQLVSTLATFTLIDGEESCISGVVEELGKNEWVHFACHGHANRTKPFESAFALQDGHFTIQQIIGCNLKNPEFAYLSACHTTVGDEESPDEVIHLASAMQFIGFRSVIGTMWAVDDAETNKITSMFYKHMVDESGRLDHARAALALNKTMKSVRIPFDQQILYIHLGA